MKIYGKSRRIGVDSTSLCVYCGGELTGGDQEQGHMRNLGCRVDSVAGWGLESLSFRW